MSAGKIFVYAVLCVLLVFSISLMLEDNSMPEELPAESESEYITEGMPVRVEKYFKGCHHLTTEIVESGMEFHRKSFDELSSEGWYVFHGDEGVVCAYAEEEGLCPADEDKYHLIQDGEGLVIIHGPIGYEGEFEGRIKVDIEKLPQLWQGMLQKSGVEFKNREELMIALESLDEL